MANTTLFKSNRGSRTAPADTKNAAGGRAYKFENKHALAQLASTGCLNNTYYTDAKAQLDEVIELCKHVDPEFIAKTALYARERGYMKDMPALLCALLTLNGQEYVERVFNRVINNGRMLRNFVQIVRSDTIGRKSLGSLPRRLVRNWLSNRSDEKLFRDSVGNNPSIADVIKMVHPSPDSKSRNALYGYLLGKKYDKRSICKLVKDYETFKLDKTDRAVPEVPFQMLDSLDIGKKEWTEIAKNAPWQMTRMNIRTFARHGVFQSQKMIKMVADRLRDEEQIRKVNVFPYQLMMAYSMCDNNIPHEIQEALQDAMEIAISNVPAIDGKVVVCPDVSGSMGCSVTGYREGSTSKVTCVDVAALFSAAMLRVNKSARVLPFECGVRDIKMNSRDSVMTNAQKLARLCGGGTNCSAPLALLNNEQAKVDLVVFVSDNQSWVDSGYSYGYGSRTGMTTEWKKLKTRNKNAKLVCIDIQPYTDSQVKNASDCLNVGGFNDQVFDLVADFANNDSSPNYWVDRIEEVEL